ncbi:hypothetical protein TNCV_1030511 [Trichonephila clavipes]|nr:hypothetical protein TNCV_1030511 [Trichonephila clavipes]
MKKRKRGTAPEVRRPGAPEGQKIYENCTKCNLVQATPDHLLLCAGLDREDIYSSLLLVYDFLRTLRLMDLV